jgi:hypothetical protein
MSEFDSRGQGKRKKGLWIPGVLGLALFGKFSRLVQRFLETLHSSGVGFSFDPMQESFLVQKEITGEHPLTIKLFEEIAGGHGDLAKRLFRMLRFPRVKLFARSGKVQRVEGMKSCRKFWHGVKRRSAASFVGTGGASRRREQ